MMYTFFDVKMTNWSEGATRTSLEVVSHRQPQSGPDPTVVL